MKVHNVTTHLHVFEPQPILLVFSTEMFGYFFSIFFAAFRSDVRLHHMWQPHIISKHVAEFLYQKQASKSKLIESGQSHRVFPQNKDFYNELVTEMCELLQCVSLMLSVETKILLWNECSIPQRGTCNWPPLCHTIYHAKYDWLLSDVMSPFSIHDCETGWVTLQL